MSAKLINYEIDLLRSMNGEDVPGLMWGAAMGVAIERLLDDGYVAERLVRDAGEVVALRFEITDKGRAAITQGEREG